MRRARANRLARRAFRLRDDGSRGPGARLAWRTLTRMPDWNAVMALREAWLRDPRDDTWQDVRRFYPPADVLAAAVDPGRSAESRAALGAFCLGHGMVPDNDVARALFFVLTGEHERYEALDPDGTLLASGYRLASEETREVLRDTMLGLGELDAVRVIADRPDRPLAEDEADYLVSQLAGAGDWAGLWRLVPTIPLTAAVRAAKEFGDWRPADDLGQAFFARLAAAGPELAADAAAAAVTMIEIEYPWEFSFAPDGSELAIRHESGTAIHDPRTGRQLASYPEREQLNVLALGNGVIVHEGGTLNGWSIVRCSPDQPDEVLLHNMAGSTVGRTPAGFVVSHGPNLWFGTASGPWSDVASVDEIGGMVAADPESGRVVLRDTDDLELVLFDAGLTELCWGYYKGQNDGAFCGPDRLLLWRWGEGRAIESWRLDDPTFVRTATIALDDTYLKPVSLPARTLVVVRREPGRLAWLAADTLIEVDGPEGFPVVDARRLAFSQDGALAAVASDAGTEVYDLELCRLVTLFGRPVSLLAPAELAAVAAQAKWTHAPPVTEALELLRAGLEYRFGAEVALGTWVAPSADDIALGGE